MAMYRCMEPVNVLLKSALVMPGADLVHAALHASSDRLPEALNADTAALLLQLQAHVAKLHAV